MTNEPEGVGYLTENDNNNDDVVTLRNFLVEGFGSRLIRLLSDLDVTVRLFYFKKSLHLFKISYHFSHRISQMNVNYHIC